MSEDFLIGPGPDNYGEGWLDPKPKKRIRQSKAKKKLTQQRRWQIAQNRKGLCMLCQRPLANSHHCEYHREKVSRHANSYNYNRMSTEALRLMLDKYKRLSAQIRSELKRRG